MAFGKGRAQMQIHDISHGSGEGSEHGFGIGSYGQDKAQGEDGGKRGFATNFHQRDLQYNMIFASI